MTNFIQFILRAFGIDKSKHPCPDRIRHMWEPAVADAKQAVDKAGLDAKWTHVKEVKLRRCEQQAPDGRWMWMQMNNRWAAGKYDIKGKRITLGVGPNGEFDSASLYGVLVHELKHHLLNAIGITHHDARVNW